MSMRISFIFILISMTLLNSESYSQTSYSYFVEFEGNRFKVDGTSLVKNIEGKILPFKVWSEMMSSGEYRVRPLSVLNGKPSEILIRPHSDQERIDLNNKMQARANQLPNAIKVGAMLDDFALTDIDGKSWILSQLKGKIIVLNSWFTGCAPCVKEIPELNELVRKYSNKNVVFLSLAMGDDEEKIKRFLTKWTFDYQHIPYRDAQHVIKRYGIMGYPSHVILNGKRKVAHYAMGYHETTVSTLDSELFKLTDKKI